MGSGGDLPFKSEKGRRAREEWADAAVAALIWSNSGGSSSSRSSSIRIMRDRMVTAARERFLDDSVVAK
jgi:hypothetical protein